MSGDFPGCVYCFNPDRDEPELVAGDGSPVDELPLLDYPERLLIHDGAEDGREIQAWRVWLLDHGATFEAVPARERQTVLALRKVGRAILLMSCDAGAVGRIRDGLEALSDAEHQKPSGWTAGIA